MSKPVVSMTMNTEDFNRVLRDTFAQSSRTFPEFINGQALRLASFAQSQTQRADASKIAATLGQTSSQITNLKTGARLKKAKRVYTARASLDMYRILNWRRVRAGKEPLGGKAMSKPARKFRAASLRSSAYIASGWIWATKTLAKIVGYRDVQRSAGAKVSGAAKGYAKPATFTLNGMVACEVANTALLAETAARTGSRKGAPMRMAERGLAIARNLTAKDMLAHLARKLQPVLDKHSAK